MAPEVRCQIKGVRISVKADIWSIACVIYFFCTGEEAFKNFEQN